jgi:hypothetical protein
MINLQTGELITYFGHDFRYGEGHPHAGKTFAEIYGGKQYYTSRSKLSGAGWIPRNPLLIKVGGYRTDAFGEWYKAKTPLWGWHIIAPYDWRGDDKKFPGTEDGSWPIFILPSNGAPSLYVLPNDGKSILRFLSESGEKWEDVKEEKISFDIYRNWDETEKTHLVFSVIQFPGVRMSRREMAAYCRSFFYLEFEAIGAPIQSPFLRAINVFRKGDRYYVLSHDRLVREMFFESEKTLEKLVEVGKKNGVVVLRDNICIIPPNYSVSGDSGRAIGVFEMGGEEIDYEINLNALEFIRALKNADEIISQLEAGAREKYSRILANREREKLWEIAEAEREKKFQELCRQYAELEISIEDSLAAGNCRPGTEDFRKKFFPNRESVKVGELMRFISVDGVRQVLKHKLLPLADASASAN